MPSVQIYGAVSADFLRRGTETTVCKNAPLFDGHSANYRAYRKRLTLYHRKIELSKKGRRSNALNILGSFQHLVWRLFDHFRVDTV